MTKDIQAQPLTVTLTRAAVFQHAYVLSSARSNAKWVAADAALIVVLSVVMQIVLQNITLAVDTVIIVLVLIFANVCMLAPKQRKYNYINDR